jgi:mannose-6-phosphate isomerase-like protein (cupin superfamily)
MEFIDIDEDGGRALLASVGTEIHRVGQEGGAEEARLVAETLAEDERHLRGTFDATAPSAGEEHAAHCAWHTNAVVEAHTITSGRGLFQFWTTQGAVSVVLTQGDLLVNRGAEHRFLPLGDQRLRLRHSGPPDADFGYADTGRGPMPWPPVS